MTTWTLILILKITGSAVTALAITMTTIPDFPNRNACEVSGAQFKLETRPLGQYTCISTERRGE